MFYREKNQINNSEEKKQKREFSTKKPLLSRVKVLSYNTLAVGLITIQAGVVYNIYKSAVIHSAANNLFKEVRTYKDIDQHRESIFVLAKYLEDKHNKYNIIAKHNRIAVVWVLATAASGGEDISQAIPALTKVLEDKDEEVRFTAAEALRDAAKNGQDISQAIPALAKVLDKDEDKYVRHMAALALENAAKNGQDISQAIRVLTKAREDEDPYVREAADKALELHQWHQWNNNHRY